MYILRQNGSCKLKIMLCICLLFLKYRKVSRTFLENFKNSILSIFVPLTIIENIGFYPTLINFILFRQIAYQLIWVANSIGGLLMCFVWQRPTNSLFVAVTDYTKLFCFDSTRRSYCRSRRRRKIGGKGNIHWLRHCLQRDEFGQRWCRTLTFIGIMRAPWEHVYKTRATFLDQNWSDTRS